MILEPICILSDTSGTTEKWSTNIVVLGCPALYHGSRPGVAFSIVDPQTTDVPLRCSDHGRRAVLALEHAYASTRLPLVSGRSLPRHPLVQVGAELVEDGRPNQLNHGHAHLP